MKIYKAVLIQPEDKQKVRVWDSPEPKWSDYSNGFDRNDLEYLHFSKLAEWKKAYKEYDIHPDYVERFLDEVFNNSLKQGIDLNPELIEIRSFRNGIITPIKDHNDKIVGGSFNAIEYAILKDKVEEVKCGDCNKFYRCTTCDSPCDSDGHFVDKLQAIEDEYELADTIRLSYLKHGNDSWVSIAKDVKEKYTLKRK